jgi:hypothetical protein
VTPSTGRGGITYNRTSDTSGTSICSNGFIGDAPADRPCIFPFVFNGESNTNCTIEHTVSAYAWCATAVDADLAVIQWGGCKPCAAQSLDLLDAFNGAMSKEGETPASEEDGLGLVQAPQMVLVTALPTPAPLHICADGNHGCDTQSTACVVHMADESMWAACECVAGYEKSADSVVSCNKMLEPCNSTMYGCETVTEICVPNPLPHCECVPGYTNSTVELLNGDLFFECLTTPVPTYHPTILPTMPVAAPTINPTARPTYADLCEGGNHGCDTKSTVCRTSYMDETERVVCECLPGYEANDDNLQMCITAQSMEPTKQPTIARSAAASNLLGTLVPSAVPTERPTLAPTAAVCADGNHGEHSLAPLHIHGPCYSPFSPRPPFPPGASLTQLLTPPPLHRILPLPRVPSLSPPFLLRTLRALSPPHTLPFLRL